MKMFVAKQCDLEYEVDDIMLFFEFTELETLGLPTTQKIWIKGFDDVDWKEADEFAEKLAKTLKCEYVGEVFDED